MCMKCPVCKDITLLMSEKKVLKLIIAQNAEEFGLIEEN